MIVQRINIIFERINEPKDQANQATGNTTFKNIFSLNGILITALIIILGLVVYFTFRKK